MGLSDWRFIKAFLKHVCSLNLLSYENANKIAAAFVPQDNNFTPKDVEYFSQIKVENFDTIKDLVVGYLDKLLPVQDKENIL